MGRPRKYKRVEDMERGIEAYFESCKPEYMLDEDGKPCLDRKGDPIILSNRRPTMAGLALALGFDSREALFHYLSRVDEDDKPYFNAITRAKCRIEDENLQLAYQKDSSRGACFVLQNGFGYREQSGVELSGGITKRVIDVKLVDDDEG